MSVRLNRTDFLTVLEAVKPGLRSREVAGGSGTLNATIAQGDCYAFLGGRAWAFNGETCCHGPSGLPAGVAFAVQAGPLLKIVQKMPEGEFEAALEGTDLVLTGERGREVRLLVSGEVRLPVADVERPGSWSDLPTEFGEAIQVVVGCCGRNEAQFYFQCVHLHPQWVEACDDFHMARYRVSTGLASACLVYKESVKNVIPLGMTKIGRTDQWVHFKNPSGIVVSCRLYEQEYPDLTQTYLQRGAPTGLPKSLAGEVEFVAVLASEVRDNDAVTVELEPGRMRLVGVGVTGKARGGWLRADYKGGPYRFSLPVAVMERVAKNTHAEIVRGDREGEDRLRVDGQVWRYVTVLGVPDHNGEAAHEDGGGRKDYGTGGEDDPGEDGPEQAAGGV